MNDLAKALRFAAVVQRVLPIDEAADRAVREALRRMRAQQPPPRKVKPKRQP